MRLRSETIKGGIKSLGGIQEGEFTTASGQRANCKVELDVLAQQSKISRFIRQLVISEMASFIELYEPDLLISIPTGADHLADGLSRRLYVPAAYLYWRDKTLGQKRLEPRTSHDKELLEQAGRIALIDDVLFTGSSLTAAYDMEQVGDKVALACVAWDRSDGSPYVSLPFEVAAAVVEPIPHWVEE